MEVCKIILLYILLLVQQNAVAQLTQVFIEDFNSSPYDFNTTAPGVSIQNTYYSSPSYALRGLPSGIQDIYMTSTLPLSFTGKNYVQLEFSHIVKLSYTIHVYVEVSNNNGASWTQVNGQYYLPQNTTCHFDVNNYFWIADYAAWEPTFPSNSVNNGMWKDEVIDISAYAANFSSVLIRFKISSVDPLVAGYGYLLDNVKIKVAPCNPVPPVIVVNPQDPEVFHSAPYEGIVTITDPDNITDVNLFVSYNGVNGPFTQVADPVANGNPDEYIYSIPGGTIGQTVAYYFTATDGTCNPNLTTSEVNSFLIMPHVSTPVCEDFEAGASWSAATFSGGGWQWGLPFNGAPNTTHSGTKAWDVVLNSSYPAGSHSELTSPVYDVHGMTDAVLNFWYNASLNAGDLADDGVQLQYKTLGSSGADWKTLGAAPAGTPKMEDSHGSNWYYSSHCIPFNNCAEGSNDAFSGNTSGWINATYNLFSVPEIITSNGVQFRFVFKSTLAGDGFTIDDFCIDHGVVNDDVEALAIDIPGGNFTTGTEINIKGIIVNKGNQPQNITVTFKEGATVISSSQITIAPVETKTVDLQTSYVVQSGMKNLCIEIDNPADVDNSNNSKCVAITGEVFPGITPGMALVTQYKDNGYKLLAYDLAEPKINGAEHGSLWQGNKVISHPDWKNLGYAFGVTTMSAHGGSYIYVTSGPCYFRDPSFKIYERVFKIDAVTGAIITSVDLPGDKYHGLGNICADQEHEQLFVTSFFDGKIYRLDPDLNILSSYDPFGVYQPNSYVNWATLSGHLPCSEILPSVGYYNNKLYFSQWNNDVWNAFSSNNCITGNTNKIWSIDLDAQTHDFAGQPLLEIDIPKLNGQNYSNPVTSISFSKTGEMLLAERAFFREYVASSGIARVLRYSFNNYISQFLASSTSNGVLLPGWNPSLENASTSSLINNFTINSYSVKQQGAFAAGGAAWGLNGYIYATGDLLINSNNHTGRYTDGLALIPVTGNTPDNADLENYYVGVMTEPTTLYEENMGAVHVVPLAGPCPKFDAFTVTPVEDSRCNCFEIYPGMTPQPTSGVFIIQYNYKTFTYQITPNEIGFTYCFEKSSNQFLNVTITFIGPDGCESETNFTILNCPQPPPCSTCLAEFAPQPGKEYIIGAWVKEKETSFNVADVASYAAPELYIDLLDDQDQLLVIPGLVNPIGPFKGSGPIIDGWQRVEGNFLIHSLSTRLRIRLQTAGRNSALFDDIRVFPKDATMKTFAYDPSTLRLDAELDERNFATFYEYDQEGKLSRIKKETERGIMTIQETKSNLPKQ